jgi:small subunit ribosomal protein S8
MLARIRNAQTARHDYADIPLSKLKLNVAEVLKKEGYVKDLRVKKDGAKGRSASTWHTLAKREPAIAGLDRVSKPGLQCTLPERDPRGVRRAGHRDPVTPQGVMTGKEARKRSLGGEFSATSGN